MHKQLPNSPLKYVLAQVKFSNIESIHKYIPELQEDIRQTFPLFNKIEISAVEIRPNIVPIASTVNSLWHFMDKESTCGILLDSNSLTIHTSKYTDFAKLTESFRNILNIFNKRLNISMYVRLGLRYINAITSNLSEYIKPELLGFIPKNNNHFQKSKFFVKTEITQESNWGIVNIKSMHFGDKDVIKGINNYLITPELIQIAQFLSFDHYKQPNDDFLILDIDHFQNKHTEFSVKKIISELSKSQEIIYEVFCSAITNKALENWQIR